MVDWKEYLARFERKVLIPLYEQDVFAVKSEPVPTRTGKLHKTDFGEFIGKSFKYDSPLSFNYYGLFKPSSAFLKGKPMPGRTTITAPVIHFSSIKVEHLEKLDKKMLLDFVSFKKFLVALRWKEKKSITKSSS